MQSIFSVALCRVIGACLRDWSVEPQQVRALLGESDTFGESSRTFPKPVLRETMIISAREKLLSEGGNWATSNRAQRPNPFPPSFPFPTATTSYPIRIFDDLTTALFPPFCLILPRPSREGRRRRAVIKPRDSKSSTVLEPVHRP